jgi:hypothetical protein
VILLPVPDVCGSFPAARSDSGVCITLRTPLSNTYRTHTAYERTAYGRKRHDTVGTTVGPTGLPEVLESGRRTENAQMSAAGARPSGCFTSPGRSRSRASPLQRIHAPRGIRTSMCITCAPRHSCLRAHQRSREARVRYARAGITRDRPAGVLHAACLGMEGQSHGQVRELACEGVVRRLRGAESLTQIAVGTMASSARSPLRPPRAERDWRQT